MTNTTTVTAADLREMFRAKLTAKQIGLNVIGLMLDGDDADGDSASTNSALAVFEQALDYAVGFAICDLVIATGGRLPKAMKVSIAAGVVTLASAKTGKVWLSR